MSARRRRARAEVVSWRQVRWILTAPEILRLRNALQGRKIAVCFGGGVDSTAMLVALKLAGIRPDVITFADAGAEKRLTYQHVRRMQRVLAAWGFPPITIVRKRPLEETGYTNLEGNCLKNETLPSLAFGLKSCSMKWKTDPQDQFIKGVSRGPNACAPHAIWIEAQAGGVRITKLIGYDSGPADRRRSSRLKSSDADFDYCYPLQLLGWKRHDCVKVIVAVLGPELVPIKSACFLPGQ